MATYTHFEVSDPYGLAWQYAMGSSYSPSAQVLTIANTDGTLTKALGAFVVIQGTLIGGTIVSLWRTSADGGTVYEKITGIALDAKTFAATPALNKLASALAGADDLNGYSGNDFLFGGAQTDHLWGNDGDDYLHGGTGADVMAGGLGNDTYVVDHIGDVINEAPNGGIDTISTSLATYTLPANFESLSFQGAGIHTGTGNALDNILHGTSGKDVLFGLDGYDKFFGDGGGDTLVGGKGDDFYHVFAGDTVIEAAGEGTDYILTYLNNYQLPANVETLEIGGGAQKAWGNELDNRIFVNGGPSATVFGLSGNDTITSSGGNDIFYGGFGDDTLKASVGTDTLIGGIGNDKFIIGHGKHVITDFAPGTLSSETIDLAENHPGSPGNFGQFRFTTIADVLAHTSQVGGDAIIDLGGGTSLTLKNVQKADLVASDFVGLSGGAPHWMASSDIGMHPTGWQPAATGDFNADGTSDVLWFNPTNGNAELWKIDDGKWAGSIDIGAHPLGYTPAASGDFNGDGTSDVLWHNPANGAVDLWKISNGQWAGSIDVGPHPLSWQVAGSGDFNADGTSDLLWFNPATGHAEVWKMSDGQWAGSVDVGAHPAGYTPVATADFTGEGTSDVLWFNPETGHVDLWKISDGHWEASVDVGTHPAGYAPVGAGDFNQDGTSDVVWFNAATGHTELWLMADGHWSASVDLGAHPAGWSPAGVGDFDHNGTADIMWQQAATNHMEAWLLANS